MPSSSSALLEKALCCALFSPLRAQKLLQCPARATATHLVASLQARHICPRLSQPGSAMPFTHTNLHTSACEKALGGNGQQTLTDVTLQAAGWGTCATCVACTISDFRNLEQNLC